MKKIITAAVLLAGAYLPAQAQIGAGTILLGGSLGYSSQKTEGSLGFTNTNELLSKENRFSASPTAAYFLADNLAVGINLGYSRGTTIQNFYAVSLPGSPNPSVRLIGESEQVSRSFSVGPMARYYKFVGDKAAFFGQLGGGYRSSRSEITSPPGVFGGTNQLTTGSGFYGVLSPGFAFFPSDKFGLEVSLCGLGYQRLNQETNYIAPSTPEPNPRKSTLSTFDAGLGLSSLQLGAAFYLGRK
ncbi:hypothetical protein LJY25_05035 [Hymenobacter sp. BT175]|uniref:hypothetical protein n=1 Tax=Hymenobacter translucens TaxID=2886507 RepID=UPI001D0F265F|nr:hypothetical protein [Hymenobacter translucens]MCC2545801.1 hypothetical protein [Hymenobacter translucens]